MCHHLRGYLASTFLKCDPVSRPCCVLLINLTADRRLSERSGLGGFQATCSAVCPVGLRTEEKAIAVTVRVEFGTFGCSRDELPVRCGTTADVRGQRVGHG